MPTQPSRRHLTPLAGGPWLDDCRETCTTRTLALGGLGGGVFSLLIANVPGAVAGVWWTLGLAGFVVALFSAVQYGAARWTRGQRQTCPACLRHMRRGATTCPHCQFQPPEEEV
jgi:hypothetical protein